MLLLASAWRPQHSLVRAVVSILQKAFSLVRNSPIFVGFPNARNFVFELICMRDTTRLWEGPGAPQGWCS
jgi:hypothetical protein